MRFPATLCFAALAVALPSVAQDKLPEGPGKAVILKVCRGCHGADVVATKRQTREEWEHTVVDMINAGATGTDDEFSDIVDYLTKNFPKVAKVNVNQAAAAEMASALGITSKEAESIVGYRQKNGAYKAIEDLKKVPELDYAKVEAKKDRLQFE
jgi:competence protein ComEA